MFQFLLILQNTVKKLLHDNDMISCPPNKWLWYLHQVGSVPMDDCTKRHATLPWGCHVYDVHIPIAIRLLLAPLLQGLHLGPHDVKSSLCMWQLSPSFCGYTLFLQLIFIHTQESHIPRLKDGFHWKVQHIVNLIYKQHFWKWKCFQFHFCSSHFKSVHYHYTKISLSIYTGSKWHTGYRTDKIHGLLKYFTA